MNKLGTYLKNIFFLLVLLQLIPFFTKTIKSTYNQFFKPKTQIGVLPLRATIDKPQPYIKNIRKFYKDDNIKAVLLIINSGGGSAGAAQTIFDELITLKKEHLKPTIVLVENICASGAYYIACAADVIVAPRASFVGSIGVYIPQPQLHEFLKQFKIDYTVVKTGTYKTAGDPLLPTTPENTELLKGLTESTYNQFVHDVAQQRKQLSKATQNGWAQGKIFTGEQAQNIGLIDHCGSFSDVERIIKEKAPIEGQIEWIYPPKPSRFEQLFGVEDNEDEITTTDTWVSNILAQTIKKLITKTNNEKTTCATV